MFMMSYDDYKKERLEHISSTNKNPMRTLLAYESGYYLDYEGLNVIGNSERLIGILERLDDDLHSYLEKHDNCDGSDDLEIICTGLDNLLKHLVCESIKGKE